MLFLTIYIIITDGKTDEKKTINVKIEGSVEGITVKNSKIHAYNATKGALRNADII
jgi:hypothetical protein